MPRKCPFCEIAAGTGPASIVYQDNQLMCLITRRPTRPGECLFRRDPALTPED